LDGLRRRVGKQRIVAVFEPRSNTMRMGVHREAIAPSLHAADDVWLYAPPDLGWDIGEILRPLADRGHSSSSVDQLAVELTKALRPGDHVLIMSNGGFGGLHGKLLEALRGRFNTR
jgi:UDP-N-acetylmuramate: L-alanyl-gamma-D-glutamyl-meso-diaminopimelate ligase